MVIQMGKPDLSISKKWYLSKTLWFNALSAVAVIINSRFNGGISEVEITSTLIFGNALLRIFTGKELTK